jgi:hypothetical protein
MASASEESKAKLDAANRTKGACCGVKNVVTQRMSV